MNQRIRELAKEAIDYCSTRAENKAWLWEEKFAELVIKECIQACVDRHVMGTMESQATIEKHFKMKFDIVRNRKPYERKPHGIDE